MTMADQPKSPPPPPTPPDKVKPLPQSVFIFENWGGMKPAPDPAADDK
jgi:hypothetical protein